MVSAIREVEPITEYQLHPSVELRQLLAKMRVPHQGQDPTKASVLFVGLDANYAAQISDDPIFFRRIHEYHEAHACDRCHRKRA